MSVDPAGARRPGAESAARDAARRADAEAARALAARDPGLPAVGVLLDPYRLAEAAGETVGVTRMRYKPGASIALAVDDGGERRWIAAYADPVKLQKTRRRAQRAGYDVVPVRGVDGGLSGPAYADRELVSTVHRLRRTHPELVDDAVILRHNPHRRLVLRAGRKVVKIAAEAPTAGRIAVLSTLAAAGVPVLVPDAPAPGVTTTSWWGDGDLASAPSPDAAAAAGAALAALHRVDAVRPPAGSAAEPRTAIRALAVLSPAAAERAAALALALAALPAGGPAVMLHGDLTADQVLVGGEGVRLIDFDRLGSGPPERDLGSFVAGERLRARADGRSPADADRLCAPFLDAYRAAGGSPDDDAVRRWTAAAVLLRAAEPFRQARPDWRTGIEAALDVAEEALR
ncbi:phosphotransferase family protein [Microbacterium sp. 18062]|uniref:phosphotransferase family protein n=1 Tax=Microbacterium sp. 18062 TaxID=2681410 RepID=UPI00135A6534|nr:phosphotransferase [Microbacterium sp. 18062]